MFWVCQNCDDPYCADCDLITKCDSCGEGVYVMAVVNMIIFSLQIVLIAREHFVVIVPV